jgi:hypothetical protein
MKYNIADKHAQDSVIALAVYESGQLKAIIAYTSSTVGKGTRNIQSPTFNREHATALCGADKTNAASDVTGVLGLAINDQNSFASAAWFMSSLCPNLVLMLANGHSGYDQARSVWLSHGPGC